MKLLTFRVGRGAPRLGALAESVAVRGEPEASRVDESVVLDLAAIATDLGRGGGTARRRFPRTMLELVEGGAVALAMVGEVVEAGSARLRRDGVDALAGAKLAIAWGDTRPEAPIPRPARNVFCLGRNYAEHAAERGAEAPKDPVYFTKAPECVIAPGAAIVHHAATKELDYEVELAVVIGTRGRDIARDDALAHVFGYTVVNDVTARDLQRRHGQWFKGKSLDTFCPMGPVLITADEIPDPQALTISLRLNGETRQSSHTSRMIFPVAQCIEVLSIGFTLLPGDVIATGTPEGVGAATGRFLQAGDDIEAEVERIGVLRNPVV